MTLSYRPRVRLNAEINGPLRSMNDYQFGFYDTGFLRQAVQALSEQHSTEKPVSFRMATLPIPQTPSELRIAEAIVRHPQISYAIVDKDKMAFVIIEGCPGWLEAFKRLGYEVYSGDKTAKRLKTFHRPALLNATFAKDELNVMIVDPTQYSEYNFNDPEMLASLSQDYPGVDFKDPKVLARLLDGGFVISSKLIQRAVANLPVYEPSKTTDTKEYYYDWRIRKKLVRNLLKQKVYNARIVFDKGFLKGNCIVSDNLPDGVDIITSQDNIKSEIKYENGFKFIAEPQGSHERVITDDQTLINLPNLFRQSDMEFWLDEEYKKMFDDAINCRLLTNWREIYKRQFRNLADAEDEEANSRMSYVGYRWVSSGMKITDSPWLFETLATSHAKPYQSRVPIPCSVYEQVIPESLAHMAGYELSVQVEQGQIIRINEIGVHVVNDADWLEMYESHGGHDEDDYFKLFYRTMEGGERDGQKVVIVCRSPNGIGEYSIFQYVEGQWSPTWHKADGTPIKFPTVSGRGWPKRLSECIRDKEVRYTGFPSEHVKKSKKTGLYTQDDVISDIKVAMIGGNVGGYVNAAMVHSLIIHKHRPIQLCSMEKAIDKCINPDFTEDVLAIDEEAKKIVREIIDSAQPIDTNVWLKRGFKRYLKDGEEVVLHDGKITQMNSICSQKYSEYCQKIRNWAQINAKPPQIVHDLAQRLYFQALATVKDFRSKIYQVNVSETTQSTGSIVRGSWESMYTDIVNIINSFQRIEDRHDFVLSMYSVSLSVPTSAGKITDQIVMNRFVYPYLESALQFYGIASTVFFTPKTDGDVDVNTFKSDKWQYDKNIYHDPMSFQEAHRKDTEVVFTPTIKFARTSSVSRY